MYNENLTTENTEVSQSFTENFFVFSVLFSLCPLWLIFSFVIRNP